MNERITRLFYFGCYGEAGHYLYRPTGNRVVELGRCYRGDRLGLPFAERILDGGLIPDHWPRPDAHLQGQCFLAHINGWTLVSFRDYSGDTRPGSNSVFLVDSVESMRVVIDYAAARLPALFARFPFPLVSCELLDLPGEEWRVMWTPSP